MTHWLKWLFILSIAVITSGCSLATSTPAPTTSLPQFTSITRVGTPTPKPTLTQTQTLTRTLLPSSTPTHTLPPTFTPAPTFTPNLTPTEPPTSAGTAAPQPITVISPNNAAQVSELARWGAGSVYSVGYSPNGRYLRVVSGAGEFFYDAQTLEEVAGAEPIRQAFVATGKLTWEWADNGDVLIKQISDGALINTLAQANSPVWAFSPDWSLVVTQQNLGTLEVWQVSNGQSLYVLELVGECYGGVTDVVFSSNGKFLAAGCVEQGLAYVWRISDGQLLQVLNAQDWIVFSLAFSPDSTLVATVETGGVISVWRVSDGALLYEIEDSQVLWVISQATLAFSPDGSNLVVGFPNGEVLVYRVRDGQLLKHLRDVAPSGESIGFSADGRLLAVGAWDSIQVWQMPDGMLLEEQHAASGSGLLSKMVYKLPPLRSGPSGGVMGVAISPDGQSVAATFDTGDFRLWQILPDGLRPASSGIAPPFESEWIHIMYSPSGELFASVLSQRVNVLHTEDWELLFDIPASQNEFLADGAFSGDGRFIAALSFYGAVQVWEVKGQSEVAAFDLEGQQAGSIALSPTGDFAVVAMDNAVQVLTVADGALQYIVEEPADASGNLYRLSISAVVFSPDGNLFATAASNGVIRLWRTSDGALLRILKEHQGRIESLAFSADGRYLASGSLDGTVRLWGVRP